MVELDHDDVLTKNCLQECYDASIKFPDAGFMYSDVCEVYENGEIIFESSNGLRSIDPIDSLTLNSQFRLASVSKQFTSVAIMKLKQEGKLDYDQKDIFKFKS